MLIAHLVISNWTISGFNFFKTLLDVMKMLSSYSVIVIRWDLETKYALVYQFVILDHDTLY